MFATSSGAAALDPLQTQAPLPVGIFPLSREPGPWRGYSPLPAVLREASLPPRTDPAILVRSVTGAVVAVSAAIRHLSAALAREGEKDADIARALAALDAAVADQSITARAVLKRLSDTPQT